MTSTSTGFRRTVAGSPATSRGKTRSTSGARPFPATSARTRRPRDPRCQGAGRALSPRGGRPRSGRAGRRSGRGHPRARSSRREDSATTSPPPRVTATTVTPSRSRMRASLSDWSASVPCPSTTSATRGSVSGASRSRGRQLHGAAEPLEVGEHALVGQRQPLQRVTDQRGRRLQLRLDDLARPRPHQALIAAGSWARARIGTWRSARGRGARPGAPDRSRAGDDHERGPAHARRLETARPAASPNRHGTLRARRLFTMSGSRSMTTNGMANVSSASPIALPTRPNPHRTTWSRRDSLRCASAGSASSLGARRASEGHPDEERVQEDGEQRRGEGGVVDLVAHVPGRPGHLHEDE